MEQQNCVDLSSGQAQHSPQPQVMTFSSPDRTQGQNIAFDHFQQNLTQSSGQAQHSPQPQVMTFSSPDRTQGQNIAFDHFQQNLTQSSGQAQHSSQTPMPMFSSPDSSQENSTVNNFFIIPSNDQPQRTLQHNGHHRTALEFLNSLPPSPRRREREHQDIEAISPNAIIDKLDASRSFKLILLLRRMHNVISSKDEEFKELVYELYFGVDQSKLTILQFEIFLDRLGGSSYEKLKKKYGIASDAVISTIIKRTAGGRFWNISTMKGGRDSILSDLDIMEFISIVKERENDINCLATCEAKKIAYHLQSQRALKAQRLLVECRSEGLAKKIKVQKPDKSWLQKMAQRHGLSIVPSSELETMRRIACDRKAIEDFFAKHSALLNRDPRLIFNMDETMVSSKKNSK